MGKRYKKSINKTLTTDNEKYYYLYLSNHDSTQIKEKGKKNWIDYNGIIWCPQTNNGTWIARRNGTIFITGNSYGEATYAFALHKPVLIVTTKKLKPNELPNWIIGCSTVIFTDWKSYLKYISERLGKCQ